MENPPVEPSYKEFMKGDYNLLFHGDNKEILSSPLIAGFREKIAFVAVAQPPLLLRNETAAGLWLI